MANKTERTKIMKARVNLIKENCRLIREKKTSKPLGSLIPWIPTALTIKNNHICKVPKCGSTYWTKVFLTINDVISVDSWGSFDREVIHGPLQEQVISRQFRPKTSDTMLLVTRNPWHRVYSAYMDKIYRLQKEYLGHVKSMLSKHDNYCGEIPSFEQFLQYIVFQTNTRQPLDPHWRPISTLCRVCVNNYSYIMKLESFVEDSTYVLNELFPEQSVKKDALISHLTVQYSNDNLKQIVNQFTSQVLDINPGCTNFFDTMRRLWISLQSQGLISDEVPFSETLFKGLSANNKTEILRLFMLKSEEKSLTKEEKQKQRTRYFINAYMSVKKRTLKSVQKVYENDFSLFGYDKGLPLRLI